MKRITSLFLNAAMLAVLSFGIPAMAADTCQGGKCDRAAECCKKADCCKNGQCTKKADCCKDGCQGCCKK